MHEYEIDHIYKMTLIKDPKSKFSKYLEDKYLN